MKRINRNHRNDLKKNAFVMNMNKSKDDFAFEVIGFVVMNGRIGMFISILTNIGTSLISCCDEEWSQLSLLINWWSSLISFSSSNWLIGIKTECCKNAVISFSLIIFDYNCFFFDDYFYWFYISNVQNDSQMRRKKCLNSSLHW